VIDCLLSRDREGSIETQAGAPYFPTLSHVAAVRSRIHQLPSPAPSIRHFSSAETIVLLISHSQAPKIRLCLTRITRQAKSRRGSALMLCPAAIYNNLQATITNPAFPYGRIYLADPDTPPQCLSIAGKSTAMSNTRLQYWTSCELICLPAC
jgi:hypothetical protein